MKIKSKSKELALCSALCAAALTIFVIEAQIPMLIPIPGMKLGLSNIITLFALLYLSPRDAFLILIARILLGSVFVSSPSTLIYSLSGGIICLIGEVIMLKLTDKKFIVEISITGALLHNITQIFCAAFVTMSASVFIYLPPLIISAIITGAFCGLCVKYVSKRWKN